MLKLRLPMELCSVMSDVYDPGPGVWVLEPDLKRALMEVKFNLAPWPVDGRAEATL
jgi:hypothetical protein